MRSIINLLIILELICNRVWIFEINVGWNWGVFGIGKLLGKYSWIILLWWLGENLI